MKNISFFIARRYFLSKKKKGFINVLSIIAMVGVAIGTAALVIVLSVFNGLEDLIRSLYSSFDADIKISLKEGKFFEYDEELKTQIQNIEGLATIVEVVEDNVLVRYNDGESVVRMKGVSPDFEKNAELRNHITEGQLKLTEKEQNFAVVGQGIRYDLSINSRNNFLALQFYYPKNISPGRSNPSSMYNSGILMPAGVFAIEKQYDEKYIFVPLRFARNLIGKDNECTSLEIELEDGVSVSEIQNILKRKLGDSFDIMNSDEQHASLLKAIKIEKLFIYLTFSFILAVASFNIFFALTMLALDKKRDISILFAMGTPIKTIRNIFLKEGAIISLSGALTGGLFGFIICLLQQEYGLISMNMASAVQEAYPVKMIATDFIFTMLSIAIITILASFKPAQVAAKSVEIQRL
ncbi:ABC transporter permease [Marivirga arenosa]|uniref:ABC transporter permease n=1 Tax=Marivirga arenosa TaxID=3059076 RepID=A0AA51ZWN7_9BACT|nr:ABC transporter permease [Marivirga sp. BKB1-2]WNB18119.1 ABC transporter permease [Marivirga sp. BKB1-2]